MHTRLFRRRYKIHLRFESAIVEAETTFTYLHYPVDIIISLQFLLNLFCRMILGLRVGDHLQPQSGNLADDEWRRAIPFKQQADCTK